jgi:hypothetical protein
MPRRQFIQTAASSAIAARSFAAPARNGSLKRHIRKHPLAITMWDFSWLERRWPGAGYEDWDLALSELRDRGYEAVRIDAYPHLIAEDPGRTWELLPEWNTQDWGAPSRCRVQVQPALNQFIRKCGEHGIVVGLSTWFREDTTGVRNRISGPDHLGRIWKSALDSIAADDLLKHILYVDLCNEFPLSVWTPFIKPPVRRHSEAGTRWMSESIAVVRRAHPQFDYTFSFTSEYETWEKQDVSMLDFLELHLWVTHFSDFYQKVGYNYERFDPKGYDNMALHAEKLYRSNPEHWKQRLDHGVQLLARWGKASGKPLITTECWGVVDYKDAPMLAWDWVMELCEFGVLRACEAKQWVSIATSNFCGPQFVGMWRDREWHRRLTRRIHETALPAGF